jgi:SAM-dependent methyltransferase
MVTLARAIPFTDRNLPPKLLRAYAAMGAPMNTNVIEMETHAKPIDDARNFFAEQAIAHNCKYLFFWDEDVLVPPHALRELMFIAEHYPKYAVVGGIYVLKADRPEPLVFKGQGNGPYYDWKVGEVFECTGIGMGCALVRVDVFKDIKKPWFKTLDNYSFALDNIPYGETYTEDLYFCKKVVETDKWKIAAHGQILCPHVDVSSGREYILSPDSKPFREFILPQGKKKILDIGCGTNPYVTQEGKTTTVDIRGEVKPDYRCDFRRLPFATEEFDIVHSSNTLEHVTRKEVEEAIEEWARVVKPDGELRLRVPNLELAAKRILSGNTYDLIPGTNVTALDILYGQQTNDFDFHYNGFSRAGIEGLLKKYGFQDFTYKDGLFDYMITARKSKPKKKKSKGK